MSDRQGASSDVDHPRAILRGRRFLPVCLPSFLVFRSDLDSCGRLCGQNVDHTARDSVRPAATGRQSFKLTDAAGLEHPFNPHFYFQPHYSNGMVVCRFARRLELGAVFFHEWRDGAGLHHAGPSLWIENGKLRASGREVLDVSPGEWVRFEMRASLGSRADRTWSLMIGRIGRPEERLTGLPCATGWSSLDWIGFVSNATRPSVIYLDDLVLTNDP